MKPFIVGEFVKEYMMAVVDILCLKKNLFSNSSLSARTVAWWIEEMSVDVKQVPHDCT